MNPKYLEMSFDAAGIRDSQKRLKSLIAELAVEPLKDFNELNNQFELVDEIVTKRVANVIAYWCRNKHVPASPRLQDRMSDITNTNKSDETLAEFYTDEVRNGVELLSVHFGYEVPEDYEPNTDELEFALLELEEKNFRKGHDKTPAKVQVTEEAEPESAIPPAPKAPEPKPKAVESAPKVPEAKPRIAEPAAARGVEPKPRVVEPEYIEDEVVQTAEVVEEESRQRSIVSAPPPHIREVEVVQQKEIHLDVLNITTEHAWNLIYGLIGYNSEYIQQTMVPRWQQNPATFDQDRRFLYGLYMDTIRNAAGVQYIAGNFQFADRRSTLDQMWTHYFSDLSQRIAPQLAAAKLNNMANDTWYKKLRQRIATILKNTSPVWLLALAIALVFDGLTTYISLDQTPMEGPVVLIFSILITALFQIADQLVINYRKREFEAEAMVAKYKAQTERINKTLQGLEMVSDSYVSLSMEKSQSHADWKAAEDNLKMARRGRFWSARIADINVMVTAYGFAFLFLNSEEPMAAVFEQIDIIVRNEWASIDLWVFLMVGLAVTVSFVVNTAQRTEILGWSMRRMKNDG